MGLLGWTIGAIGLAALAASDRSRIRGIDRKCTHCGETDAGYAVVATGHSTYVVQFRCPRCGRVWRKRYSD